MQLPRLQEPFTVGIPLPEGYAPPQPSFEGRHANGGTIPVQAAVLDRWSSGSPRWVLLDFQADVFEGATVSLGLHDRHAEGDAPAMAAIDGTRVFVRTGGAQFVVGPQSFPFEAVLVDGHSALDDARTGLRLTGVDGSVSVPTIDAVALEDNGPLRACVRVEGNVHVGGARLTIVLRMHFFANRATVRFELCVRNPRRAVHKGGFWELGDAGSVLIKEATVRFGGPSSADAPLVRYSAESGSAFSVAGMPFALQQDSSGGEHWQSRSHVNRATAIPVMHRGYRITAPDLTRAGLRATPVVQWKRGPNRLFLAVPQFWENFPKRIAATGDSLEIDLFPGTSAEPHELQGGEQKTHTFWLAIGDRDPTDPHIDWCRNPSHVVPDPVWTAASRAVSFLTSKEHHPLAGYDALVEQAIAGPDTFVCKREVVDEYGWRHFGEIYADHEAVFHKGEPRLISHYNNQYDALAGCIYQFLRSGDSRWWPLLDDLARHVVDIDIYHTDEDWAKYNHGLFWHTVHYKDAGMSTHRTYPRAEGVYGGGPSTGHLYTTGLMLHHFLTGAAQSRDAVVELGGFVIDSDDGRKSVFRWLDRGCTGFATASGTADYHGPGRAPGNALNALVDAHRITGEARFLEKADEIIRRCIHPRDDIGARQLLDAERRWFYTMFLQALGKYLEHKRERRQVDDHYAYAQASLLAYARWMTEHERPYLDHAEILEYPTETWAAQDMRKSEVFKWAALHASGEDRRRFLERSAFFFDYAVKTLSSMQTRSLARPVILLLSYGWSHPAFSDALPAEEPLPVASDFGGPQVFVPQKARALRRAFLAAGLIGIVALVGLTFLMGALAF